jgi:hypothetical protein
LFVGAETLLFVGAETLLFVGAETLFVGAETLFGVEHFYPALCLFLPYGDV